MGEIVYDISLVVEEIKKFPQTYNSILKDQKGNGTFQTILRRKIGKLCKRGEIFKSSIPGTRFGKKILYTFPKKYNILMEGGRAGTKVFCFFDHKRLSKYYIETDKCWLLTDGIWEESEKKIFFEGNVLKWI